MPRKAAARVAAPKGRTGGLEAALEGAGRKLQECRGLREGAIVIRAAGEGGGEFTLDCTARGVRLRSGTADTPPLVEIIGDARRIQGVLAGHKDAVAQFLAGGIRLRGDLRYFSDLALELGILEQPL